MFGAAGIWKYTHGAGTWKTYFDWTFVFGFQDISPSDYEVQLKDKTQPIRSVNKSYQQKINVNML